MKKPKLNHLVLGLIVLILSSCSPLYVPNVANVPLLSNKGEFQASVYTGTAGFDPQLSYAITDNIGVMVNASFANRKSDSTSNFHKHNFFEGGLGYYKPFSEFGKFEVFGGFGYGKVQGSYISPLWQSSADISYSRFFIQPAFGISREYIDVSFASRIVFVNFNQVVSQNSYSIFMEPVITAKFGYKYVKAVFQFGVSYPFNQSVSFDYDPIMMSIGIQANLGRIYD